MPEITVDVAGRAYRLICGAGEEKHLQNLAGLIDTEARALTQDGGSQMAEARLMLMSALMVADRLHDAQARIVELESKLAKGEGSDPARDEALTERLQRLAGRAEQMATAAGG